VFAHVLFVRLDLKYAKRVVQNGSRDWSCGETQLVEVKGKSHVRFDRSFARSARDCVENFRDCASAAVDRTFGA
jgi:hypothetical protein